MSKPKDAKSRKQAQRSRDAALGIQRVEVRLSIREREQLETLRSARAGSGKPYSADEYISTLLRRDWEHWQQQQAALATQTCQNCDNQLPGGCAGTFKGEAACWHTTEAKTLAL
ncbi:hypothetical protein LCG94_05755 [Aeromonas salmonicida]|uniref:hypothetical protein n=1 Tax=Aeromonas salmonicida TaxID=645 RepID=UPI003BB64C92